jgi:TRAP-type transport system periplasmic protein
MKKTLIRLVIFLIVTMFVVSVGHAKTTLKMVTFLPKGDINMTAWMAFIDSVNEKGEGDLEIKYIGGPEAIPGFEQFEALKNGVVDMILGCEAYYGGKVSGEAYTHLTLLDPVKEREKGYADFRNELFKPHNIHYLGRAEFGVWFHVFTNKPAKNLEDLKGQKIRTSATYESFVKKLGAVPVSMPGSDIYTALERGTIDGYAWSVLGNVQMGWADVCKYILEPRIYQMNIEGLVNKKTWENLSKDQQQLLTECMKENEKSYTPIMADIAEKEYLELQEKGMKVIQFSSEETQKYIDLAYEAGWENMIKASPDLGQKLKSMLTP